MLPFGSADAENRPRRGYCEISREGTRGSIEPCISVSTCSATSNSGRSRLATSGAPLRVSVLALGQDASRSRRRNFDFDPRVAHRWTLARLQRTEADTRPARASGKSRSKRVAKSSARSGPRPVAPPAWFVQPQPTSSLARDSSRVWRFQSSAPVMHLELGRACGQSPDRFAEESILGLAVLEKGGLEFGRLPDLAAPEGGMIGGEVAVGGSEVSLQLDGVARRQRHQGL